MCVSGGGGGCVCVCVCVCVWQNVVFVCGYYTSSSVSKNHFSVGCLVIVEFVGDTALI